MAPTPQPIRAQAHMLVDPLDYWWPVCRGPEIMRAFHAAPEPEAWRVVERHPTLLLPELVDAAEQALGRSRAIDGLREMHRALRGSHAYAAYHRLLAAALVGERRGSRRTNLERALEVIREVRRTAEDPADERTEHAIRDALAGLTPVPGATPRAIDDLFLTDGELPGLQRSDDRRRRNPQPDDRAFVAHRGLAAGAVTWLGDAASPVGTLVDARWMFASTTAAKVYLNTPSTLVLSRDSLGSPAILPIADGAHAWSSAPGSTGRQCLLFRVDRVIARLDVTEGPNAALERQTLKRDHLVPYATAVIQRVRRVLAQYWLAIGRGTVAAQAFLRASPRKADQVLIDYPILLLPEFPTAMATLGRDYHAGAERLAIMQGTARSAWHVYRETLRTLVRSLLDETVGDPQVNADAALRLVAAHRRLDADYAWATLENECRVRVETPS